MPKHSHGVVRPELKACPELNRRDERRAIDIDGQFSVHAELVEAFRTFFVHAQPSTRTLNPPQNMRLPSKGIALGSIISASRGSFMTFALMRSRSARDLYTM